jgi:GAF domain-containing protein
MSLQFGQKPRTFSFFGIASAVTQETITANVAIAGPAGVGGRQVGLQARCRPRTFHTKSLVGSDDLRNEHRWGAFSSDAAEAGLAAVLASPIPYASDAVGVVAVFSARVHAWSPEGELALMAFTDLAALAIASSLRSSELGDRADQLQTALDARVQIEQAKGVLVAQERIGPREAFQRIRADARRSRKKVSDVAADIVRAAGESGGTEPEES